jgi:hypothetical protein
MGRCEVRDLAARFTALPLWLPCVPGVGAARPWRRSRRRSRQEDDCSGPGAPKLTPQVLWPCSVPYRSVLLIDGLDLVCKALVPSWTCLTRRSTPLSGTAGCCHEDGICKFVLYGTMYTTESTVVFRMNYIEYHSGFHSKNAEKLPRNSIRGLCSMINEVPALYGRTSTRYVPDS